MPSLKHFVPYYCKCLKVEVCIKWNILFISKQFLVFSFIKFFLYVCVCVCAFLIDLKKKLWTINKNNSEQLHIPMKNFNPIIEPWPTLDFYVYATEQKIHKINNRTLMFYQLFLNPATPDIVYRNSYAAPSTMVITGCYKQCFIKQNYFVPMF